MSDINSINFRRVANSYEFKRAVSQWHFELYMQLQDEQTLNLVESLIGRRTTTGSQPEVKGWKRAVALGQQLEAWIHTLVRALNYEDSGYRRRPDGTEYLVVFQKISNRKGPEAQKSRDYMLQWLGRAYMETRVQKVTGLSPAQHRQLDVERRIRWKEQERKEGVWWHSKEKARTEWMLLQLESERVEKNLREFGKIFEADSFGEMVELAHLNLKIFDDPMIDDPKMFEKMRELAHLNRKMFDDPTMFEAPFDPKTFEVGIHSQSIVFPRLFLHHSLPISSSIFDQVLFQTRSIRLSIDFVLDNRELRNSRFERPGNKTEALQAATAEVQHDPEGHQG
ncbi:hypothetical protein EJ04DRAFT_527956 [Polyplosphaeria fusca]|uniref:Uncharacterized protein n=1 Tax=Polyplosphaeria fusca TaxID=682080 RepID=A0A9P4QQV4_9PLEO|nr:hypothetical protein EJ04DRAFT_527956 [Polyplosphaeria fusca]